MVEFFSEFGDKEEQLSKHNKFFMQIIFNPVYKKRLYQTFGN